MKTLWSVKASSPNTTSLDLVHMKCPEHKVSKDRKIREGVMRKMKMKNVLEVNRGGEQWLHTVGEYEMPSSHGL